MAKVTYIDPIEHISGKIARKHRTAYCYRRETGAKYTTQCTPSSEPPSAQQEIVKDKFRKTVAKVNDIMIDPDLLETYMEEFKYQTHYKTLRGFIFAEEYKKAA